MMTNRRCCRRIVVGRIKCICRDFSVRKESASWQLVGLEAENGVFGGFHPMHPNTEVNRSTVAAFVRIDIAASVLQQASRDPQ